MAALPSASAFPVNLVLANLPCLVVGGGSVAARKVEGLLDAGARVTVVSPDAVALISEDRRVRWFARPYQRGEVASYRLAIAATGNAEVNAQIQRDASAAAVFLNSADDPARCSFTLPAIARRGPISVAVSTGGRSPALAKWLSSRIEAQLAGLDIVVEVAAEVRAEMRARHGTSEHPGWDTAFDDHLVELASQDADAARELLRARLGLVGVRQ